MAFVLMALIIITTNHYLYAQVDRKISNVHIVHQFDLDDNENQFGVINKSDNLFRATNKPDFHYFYEFPDGSFYIDKNSYVNRQRMKDSDDDSVIFKATKIYDDDDEPPLLRTGNSLKPSSLPSLASRTDRADEFLLHISHLNENIILDEEYVIAANLADDLIENAVHILILYNEIGAEIFNEGSISPRPLASNKIPENIQYIKNKYGFGYQNYYFFENLNRNIFVNLKTKEKYQSSEDTFLIKAIAINNQGVLGQTSLELKLLNNANRAHDPNDMLVEPACFEPDNIPNTLNYTVNFENVGGAPATDVLIDVDIPDEIDINAIDFSTFRYNYPYSRPAFSYPINGSQINFKLIGIDLKGKGEAGVAKAQTMGSIRYSLPLKDNIGCTSIKSQATILFKDGWEGKPCRCRSKGCNERCEYPDLEPVTTNTAIAACEKYCEEKSDTEDCLSFDPQKLEIREEGKQYLLTDGRSRMMVFKTKDSAAKALKTILHYGFKKRCFIDRPEPGLHYFLVDDDIPKGGLKVEDCIAIGNPDNLTIEKNFLPPFNYSIVDSKGNILFLAKTKDEVKNIITTIKKYGAKYVCFVERQNAAIVKLGEKLNDIKAGPKSQIGPIDPIDPIQMDPIKKLNTPKYKQKNVETKVALNTKSSNPVMMYLRK